MNLNQLIRMANQIGLFFEAMPDRQEALAGIAKHIKDFWEPRMRVELLAHLDGSRPNVEQSEQHETEPTQEQLSPIVVDSLVTHRATLEPKKRTVGQ
jgi:formate dehydrogenase subunit delta